MKNKKASRVFVALLVLALLQVATLAQTGRERPATAFTFGEAKSHAHADSATLTGEFAGRTVINDPANTVGNLFLGNVVGVKTAGVVVWLWYDWDPWGPDLMKAAQWAARPPTVRVIYDPVCLMARSVEEAPPTRKSKVKALGAEAPAQKQDEPRAPPRTFNFRWKESGQF